MSLNDSLDGSGLTELLVGMLVVRARLPADLEFTINLANDLYEKSSIKEVSTPWALSVSAHHS